MSGRAPAMPPEVQAVFDAYPREARSQLLKLRSLIFRTAAVTEGVGEITETLKWGEPAYLTAATKSGTTIRLGWKARAPAGVRLYVHCQTSLIETFRTLFPDDFSFEGNRTLVVPIDGPLPVDALTMCIAAAQTYHLNKGREIQPKTVEARP